MAREHKDVDSGLGPIAHKMVDGEKIIVDRRVPKKSRQTQLQKFRDSASIDA
jgi:hypothetical protein